MDNNKGEEIVGICNSVGRSAYLLRRKASPLGR